MAKPDCSVPKELARMEHEKRRGYRLGAPNASTLFDGVVPMIFEQHGCPRQCEITPLNHTLRRRAQRLEQGSHLTHGVAWMIASHEHYQMFQECDPIIKIEDGPRELGMGHTTPANDASDTWSQRDALLSGSVDWQSQESQRSHFSTQGVDPTF